MPPSCALLVGFAIGARVRCYGNITLTRNVSEYMLVLALCLILLVLAIQPCCSCTFVTCYTVSYHYHHRLFP